MKGGLCQSIYAACALCYNGMKSEAKDMEITKLKELLLEQHQVRKTNAQKQAFIDWAISYAKEREIEARVEAGGKWIDSRNIVFGDVGHAHTIVTAHYDTCARMLLPNFSTPGCLPLFALEQAVLTGLIVFGGWIAGKGAGVLLDGALPLWLSIPVSIAAGFAGALLILYGMLAGPANPNTANDNTSGVLTVLLAMERLKGKRGIAFVLFDNEEKGLFGAQAFIKAHPQAARRFLLNIDCVGDGDTILYTGTKLSMKMPQAKRFYAALEAAVAAKGMNAVSGEFPRWIYPSDQMLFPRGTAAAALKGKRILYLDRIHTVKDTVLEQRNIECLLQAMDAL